MFKSVRPVREQATFKTNVETARNNLPRTHDTFRRKYDAKAVSSKVQVPPLLLQRHNAALGAITMPVNICHVDARYLAYIKTFRTYRGQKKQKGTENLQ